MLCIICLKDKPERTGAGEHVFPYGLGGSYTIQRVCETCDNRLGDFADGPLQKQFDLLKRRVELGLKGHRRTVPDPIGDAIKKPVQHPTEPGQRVRVIREPDGSTRLEAVTKIDFVVTFKDGRVQYISPTDDTVVSPKDNDRAEILVRSALKKRGVRDEAILAEYIPQFIASLETSNSDIVVSVPVAINPSGHQMGLLKIAYEMAWVWLGDGWLHDPAAIAMRSWLNENGSSGTQLILNDSMDVYGMLRAIGIAPESHHFAFIISVSGQPMIVIGMLGVHKLGVRVSEKTHEMPERDALLIDAVGRKSITTSLLKLFGKPVIAEIE